MTNQEEALKQADQTLREVFSNPEAREFFREELKEALKLRKSINQSLTHYN